MSQSIKRAPSVFNPTPTWILLAACEVALLKLGCCFVETALCSPSGGPQGSTCPTWFDFLSVEQSEGNSLHAGHLAGTPHC